MTALTGGFADPPRDSARVFRVAMRAMARPCTIHELEGAAPEGLGVAAALLLLTLADRTTPVRLAGPAAAARDWLTFHTGAPDAGPGEAAFAAGPWDALGAPEGFAIGTPDFPDRSTTLIAEVAELDDAGPAFRGPGIATTRRLRLPDPSIAAFNARRYPQGLDCYFTCGPFLAALPRSALIVEER